MRPQLHENSNAQKLPINLFHFPIPSQETNMKEQPTNQKEERSRRKALPESGDEKEEEATIGEEQIGARSRAV